MEAAKLRGETIAPHGAAAANRLGLTTQVPMRTTYLTSGRSRPLYARRSAHRVKACAALAATERRPRIRRGPPRDRVDRFARTRANCWPSTSRHSPRRPVRNSSPLGPPCPVGSRRALASNWPLDAGAILQSVGRRSQRSARGRRLPIRTPGVPPRKGRLGSMDVGRPCSHRRSPKT